MLAVPTPTLPIHRARTTVVLLALGCSTAAHAEDNIGAQHEGAGGVAIADPRTNAAITLNPGALGLTDRFDVEFLVNAGGGRNFRWGLSAVDARTNEFISFGLVYNGGLTSVDFLPAELPAWAEVGEDLRNAKQKHELTAALATNLFDRRLGIGLNGTLQIHNTRFGGNRTLGNLDVGIAARPIDYLTLAFAARDLVTVEDTFDQPLTLSYAVRGGVEELITASFEGDVRMEHVVNSGLDFRFGVDGTIRKLVKVRGGWDYNGDSTIHGFSWGVGLFSADNGTLNYAMRIPVNDPDLVFGRIEHTLSLTLFTRVWRRGEEPTESPIVWPDER
jgi:hypothetical protein